MKRILVITVLIFVMMSGMAAADVETGWPLGEPNEYNGSHIMIDFEEGVNSYDPIVCTDHGITFETVDGGRPWVYGCMDGDLNLRNETHSYLGGSYIVNGYAGAWCGIYGNGGKITFDNPVGHVSCLASMNSNLIMEAFDSNDNEVVNSTWAIDNVVTHKFTRLSVDRAECDISYVIIHDTGNKWIIDDLIVGYKSPGQSAWAHCQKFIHSQGKEHWNDSAWMNKMNPCNTE